jgi:hypothetical protein
MPGWMVFVFDLAATAGVMFLLEQLARLYRRFRPDGSDGTDGGEPWRYRPRGPRGGPHARGSRTGHANTRERGSPGAGLRR